METTVCLELGASPQEGPLAFLALPAKRASQQVTGTANDVFIAIQTILNQIMDDVCGKRTAAEFCATREVYFPQYMEVMKALSRLVLAVVPRPVIDRLCYESMSEMESDFREDGPDAFGRELSKQAMFTVWTMRKIVDLTNRIATSKDPKDSLKETDAALAHNFVTHVLYSRFHLDCLRHSLKSRGIIYPEVLEPISDGLRSLVNAYAYIREAAELRSENIKEEPILIDFDDEEQELLALSMKDI
jgi:hypothetical protein